jgi:hypothetical protein
MKRPDADLDRLLRSAAKVEVTNTAEAPYGFETRVIALWRAGSGSLDDVAEVARFLRAIGAVALAVLVLASVGAYRQFNENEARTTPHGNEYAIADSAIQSEFSQ